jgi:basic amino acid/polyamine antiporter, APA family
MQPSETGLIRGLTPSATMAMVVGSVIGTGVFLKAAVMAQLAGTPAAVLAAWLAAGLLSIAGALVYAELGVLLPQAGGEYVYLRTAYGEAVAFAYGWMRFVVGSTGTIAAAAVAFSIFASPLVPFNAVWVEHNFRIFGQAFQWRFGTQQLTAVVIILILSAINSVGVAFGGTVQSFLTVLKIFGIGAIVIGIFFWSKSGTWSNFSSSDRGHSWTGMSAFGAAMLSALWAYNGWNQMPMVAGEVRQPGRNLPRALIVGMLIVTLVYLVANLAYFYALPVSEVMSASSTGHPDALPVATKAAKTFLGLTGTKVVSVIFIVSTLGATHGCILACARVPFAMARDGIFFPSIGSLSESTRVPVLSIIVQGAWSCVLAVSGTFDQLTDCVIFASWIFYGLVTFSVIVLRRKMPEAPRPYKTLGYPAVPVVFVLVTVWLVVNTLKTRPLESVAGLVLTLCGFPIYLHYRRQRRMMSNTMGVQEDQWRQIPTSDLHK